MKKATLIKLIFLVLIFLVSCVKSKTEKIEKPQEIKGIWIDLILGGPPLPNEFKAIDLLTKRYNINYKRIEMGCEFSDKDILLKKKYEIDNAKYFKELETILGKNWKQKFDLEKQKLDSLKY